MLRAVVTVGGSTRVTVEGDTPVDLIKGVSQFDQLPKKCGHCGSQDLALEHRTAGQSDEYDYLHLKCKSCGAKGNIGQTKNPKGGIFFTYNPKEMVNVKDGFYKYWEQPNYQGGQRDSNNSPAASPQSPPSGGGGDDEGGGEIPF